MVFDMISNAPGVLNSTLTWGRLQDLTAAGGDPNPTLSLNPTAFDFKPPRVNQWNVGIQHKVWKDSHPRPRLRRLEVDRPAAAGADQLRCRSARRSCRRTRIRPAPRARSWDRRRCRTTSCGRTGATATSGCGTTAATRNYNALQTSVTRRFDRGFMFSGFWVWSKALGINRHRLRRRRAEPDQGSRRSSSTTRC